MIDEDECWEVGEIRIGRWNRSTRRKPAPVPLCPPQIPHYLTWARIRAAAVGRSKDLLDNIFLFGLPETNWQSLVPPAFSWYLPRIIRHWRWRRCSSETLVDFQQTTRRYVPEDRTLHKNRCENLKSYILVTKFALISRKCKEDISLANYYNRTQYSRCKHPSVCTQGFLCGQILEPGIYNIKTQGLGNIYSTT
jgi:hypothetical protein